MFLFKKLVTPFMLPPGLIILTLLLSGIFLIFWHRRKIGIFNLVVGLLFWIFCSAPFSNFLMRGLESDFQIPQPVKGDVIVLLGGGSIDNVPDFSGYGYKNPILVTSASHLKRSLLSFKKIGIDIVPYPANFRSKRIKNYQLYSYLPRSSSLMTTSIALHEYLGIFFFNLAYL